MVFVPDWRREMQQYRIEHDPIPDGAIVANLDEQEENNSYGVKPYYEDTTFTCQDCSKHEVWTAKKQQWWFEVAKGSINSQAVRCGSCRQRVRDEKDAQKKHMAEVAAKKSV